MVKTSNKLIGEIENRDLYESDDALLDAKEKERLFGGAVYDNQDGQTLDFGDSKPREKKEMNQLFNKINFKK